MTCQVISMLSLWVRMECEAQHMAQSNGLRIQICYFLKEESYEEACDGGH